MVLNPCGGALYAHEVTNDIEREGKKLRRFLR
jgi:hypothetical protein